MEVEIVTDDTPILVAGQAASTVGNIGTGLKLVDQGRYNMNDFDIELEYLEEQHRNGEITTKEYNRRLRDLEYDYGEEV